MLGVGETAELKAHFVAKVLGFEFGESPYLAAVRDDPQQIRDRALVYLAEYFKAAASAAPLLVLLEDLHWADNSSLEAISRLTMALVDEPILFVAAARPDLYERWPEWFDGHDFHQRIELEPLSSENCNELLQEILQLMAVVPQSLSDMVISSAEGNPFYIEELVNMLLEKGVIAKDEPYWRVATDRLAEIDVPPTLVGVLQARIDSLPDAERAIMQQASVVGRTFWNSTLSYVSQTKNGGLNEPEIDQGIKALNRREMIVSRKTSAFSDTSEHAFKNTILREVAYESVLLRLRRDYHALVARWLVEHSGGRLAEMSGLIADHLETARDFDGAFLYLLLAGDRAVEAYANEEAVGYYSRALQAIPKSDLITRYELFSARANVYDLLGKRPEQAADLAALDSLSNEIGDQTLQIAANLLQAKFALDTGDYSSAAQRSRRALEMAQQSEDAEAEAKAHLALGRTHWQQGDFNDARDELSKALTLAEKMELPSLVAKVVRQMGNVFYIEGKYSRAREQYLRAQEISRQLGDKRIEGGTSNNLGVMAALQGDYSAAKDFFERSLVISREVGERRLEAQLLSNLGMVAGQGGDYRAAVGWLNQAMIAAREVGNRQGMANTLSNLATFVCHQSDFEKGITYGREALAIAREIGERSNEAEALTALGKVFQTREQMDEAAAAFQEALNIRLELGQLNLAIEARAGLARTALSRGNDDEALEIVEEILAYLAEGGSVDGTDEPLRIYLICYRVLDRLADPRTDELLRTAHQLLGEWAARISNEDARRTFLQEVPWHKEIGNLWKARTGAAEGQ